jgi:hypothetical protein
MEAKGYKVFKGNNEFNIIYIEGVEPDTFKLNNDAANTWNDTRNVISFVNDEPVLNLSNLATTEPGSYYTERPLNKNGCARIKFGQYTAWKLGIHGNSEPHEALVQVAPVTVCRDRNKDGYRTNDKEDTGVFGINQHYGFDLANVDRASAGCLVGRSRNSHRAFIKLLKTDSRYLRDNNYIFTTTIIDGTDLVNWSSSCK